MAAKFGACHGQCVRGVAWLNDSFAHVNAAPIQPGIRYDVELRINHSMKFMCSWCRAFQAIGVPSIDMNKKIQ
jgi:hypothetical protein